MLLITIRWWSLYDVIRPGVSPDYYSIIHFLNRFDQYPNTVLSHVARHWVVRRRQTFAPALII